MKLTNPPTKIKFDLSVTSVSCCFISELLKVVRKNNEHIPQMVVSLMVIYIPWDRTPKESPNKQTNPRLRSTHRPALQNGGENGGATCLLANATKNGRFCVDEILMWKWK